MARGVQHQMTKTLFIARHCTTASYTSLRQQLTTVAYISMNPVGAPTHLWGYSSSLMSLQLPISDSKPRRTPRRIGRLGPDLSRLPLPLSGEQKKARSFVDYGFGKAIRETHVLAVQRFLANGADPNAVWDATVSHRSGSGCFLGVDHPVGTKYAGRPLHEACVLSDIRISNALIDHGADVNTRNVLGRTALHQIAEFGALQMARLLVQRGAELDVRYEPSTPENDGPLGKGLVTPLYIAVRRYKYDIAAFLLENGASPTTSAQDRDTALRLLLARFDDKHSIEMMGKLVHHGAALDRNYIAVMRTVLYQEILRDDGSMINSISGIHEDLGPANQHASGAVSYRYCL